MGRRLTLAAVGLVVATGGILASSLGAGLLGARRSRSPVLSHAVTVWWHEGGILSYAVVAAIAAVLLVGGLLLALPRMAAPSRPRHANDLFLAAHSTNGVTVASEKGLRHALEHDLNRLPQVGHAKVGLYGGAASLTVDLSLGVADTTPVSTARREVLEALERWTRTGGLAPRDGFVLLRYDADLRPAPAR